MNRTNDVRAVVSVLKEYAQGTADRDIARISKVFHSAAVMSGYLGPIQMIGSLQPFYDHLEANPHTPGYTYDIVSVSVTGRTAIARVVEDNLYGMNFINDMQLINADGTWLIVGKLFHHD